MSAATVYIVDDDAAVRSGLGLLLRSDGLKVAAFGSADEFIRGCGADCRGCVLLDVRMPGGSGLELQERMRRQSIGMPVIFLTGHGDVPMAVRALKMGAFDFIEKPFNDQLLLERVHAAMREDADQCDRRQLLREHRENFDSLTEREREVMRGLIAGHANKVIAIDLGISERTVELHRARVMEKMQVRSLAELVQIGLSLGLGGGMAGGAAGKNSPEEA